VGERGPLPKRRLELVGGRTPGRRARKPRPPVRPVAPAEPDWRRWFPGERNEAPRLRADARKTWRMLVPLLERDGSVSERIAGPLADYCVCEARLAHCNREITSKGYTIPGERGGQRTNPAVTQANQLRSQLKWYVRALRLVPDALAAGGDDDDEEVLD
jgi:phage terminase small subunit